MIHELKILPKYFIAVTTGKKTFEIRKADRPFAVGDMLALNEFNPDIQRYTGNSCLVYVDYMLSGDYCKEGYVVMSIKPCVAFKKERRASDIHYKLDYSVPYATRAEKEEQEG